VLTRNHTVLPVTDTFIHKWNEPYLPLLPSRRAWPHFGRYSFPLPLTVGGWVGLDVLVKYWGGLPVQRRVTCPSTNWARRRVTSLIRPMTLPLRHAMPPPVHDFVRVLWSFACNVARVVATHPEAVNVVSRAGSVIHSVATVTDAVDVQILRRNISFT